MGAETTALVPLTMKAAVSNGILTEGIRPVTASCPTGMCSWPLTPTLAICGGCVKSIYQTKCFPSSCKDTSSGEETCIDAGCKYTMPSGSIATLFNFDGTPSSYTVLQRTAFQVMQGTGSFYGSEHPSRLYLTKFDVFGAPFLADSTTLWPNASTISFECALWMCVRLLRTATSSTYQTQDSIEEFANVSSSHKNPDGSDSNYTFMPLPPSMRPRTQASYNVDPFNVLHIRDLLSSAITGTIKLEDSSFNPSSDTVLGIWNASSDLDLWIKNLALSMTNVIRTDTPQPDDMYNGTAYHLGYQVQWEWIVLPAALVLISTLVLIIAIVQTSRSSVSAWKGSPLTLLFMNVDVDDRKKVVGQMNTFQGLQDHVGNKQVLIKSDAAGDRVLKIA